MRQPFLIKRKAFAFLIVDGVKLRKTYGKNGGNGVNISSNITDYLDGFQYTRFESSSCLNCKTEVAYEERAYSRVTRDPGTINLPEWILDFVPTAEGFYSFKENRYIYQYRDHLGYARISYAKNSAGDLEITDSNNYYPFGLNHIGGEKAMLNGYLNYKYNGKELQETGIYDYGARFYMPDIGRWGVVDPLAEKYPDLNPMMYTNNNPIIYILIPMEWIGLKLLMEILLGEMMLQLKNIRIKEYFKKVKLIEEPPMKGTKSGVMLMQREILKMV